MSAPLQKIQYRELKDYKYELAASYRVKIDLRPPTYIETRFIMLTTLGNLSLNMGYCWDGCSGPTIDTKKNHRGGLVHDALYQLIRMGFLDRSFRKDVDQVFKTILLEDQFYLAGTYYRGVRLFGRRSTHPYISRPCPERDPRYRADRPPRESRP